MKQRRKQPVIIVLVERGRKQAVGTPASVIYQMRLQRVEQAGRLSFHYSNQNSIEI